MNKVAVRSYMGSSNGVGTEHYSFTTNNGRVVIAGAMLLKLALKLKGLLFIQWTFWAGGM